MAERHFDEDEQQAPSRQAGPGKTPGKTPGKAEGGEEREKPYPNEPGKTPGSAEGEEYADPGTARTPEPRAP